jgi:hypothetical protein
LDEPDEDDITPSYITGDELINYISQIQYWGRRVRFKDIKEEYTFFGGTPLGLWVKREGKASEVQTGKIVEMENDHRYIIFDIANRIQEITALAETVSKLKPKVHHSTNVQESKPGLKARQSTKIQNVGFGTIELDGGNEEELDKLIRKVTSQAKYTKHPPIITKAWKLKPGDKFKFIWRGKIYKGIAIDTGFLVECILYVDGKKVKACLDFPVQITITENNQA